jgi:hypothetical protein
LVGAGRLDPLLSRRWRRPSAEAARSWRDGRFPAWQDGRIGPVAYCRLHGDPHRFPGAVSNLGGGVVEAQIARFGL